MLSLLFVCAFAACINSRPTQNKYGLEYHSLETRQANLPLLKLPYGTWQATKYYASDDIYEFKNIRFAASTAGDGRWAKPLPPNPNSTLQTGAYGGTCWQSMPASMLEVTLTGGLGNLGSPQSGGNGLMSYISSYLQSKLMPVLGQLLEKFPSLTNTLATQIATQDLGVLMGGAPSSEDCLFLDLVVPGKALRGEIKLPVLNYIYGGAFIIGSKDGMYDGAPLVKQSKGNIIYVVGNYRLGAFGYLAGSTVERDATPNVGFYDQIAIFDWIQKYIGLVNGLPDQVTVMGESAGAGSIMHHLASFGGKQGPAKFKRAIIQSPANNPQPDRKGALEKQFQTFEGLAGCSGQGIVCLRRKDIKVLRAAADQIASSAPPGQYGFGPAVDGTFSRQLPDLEFASGNIVSGVESIIVTHVADEARAFVSNNLKNNHTFFADEITSTFGPNANIKSTILQKLPPPGNGSPFKDEKERFIAYMGSQFFNCHVRFITNAYVKAGTKVYVGQYSQGKGLHGLDLKADFYNSSAPPPSDDPGFEKFAPAYQDYLLSLVRANDPSQFRQSGTVEWPIVQAGSVLQPILNAGNLTFVTMPDEKTSAEQCDIWMDVWSAATKALGAPPPGSDVPTTMHP